MGVAMSHHVLMEEEKVTEEDQDMSVEENESESEDKGFDEEVGSVFAFPFYCS